MKIRNVALNTGIYFAYMFGACFITMLVEALFVYILKRFIVLDFAWLTVIRIVIYSLGVPALMAFIGYHEGYREGACSVGETTAGGFLAMIPHLLFAMLFHFQSFVSGAVRPAAGLIHNGWQITETSLVEETPYSLFLVMFLVYGLIYVGVLTVAKYLGAQKRIITRADLRMHETDRDE